MDILPSPATEIFLIVCRHISVLPIRLGVRTLDYKVRLGVWTLGHKVRLGLGVRTLDHKVRLGVRN